MTAGSAAEAWAIGVGCRKGVAAEAILSVFQEAGVERCPAGTSVFTIERKRDEVGLHEAAGRMGLRLVFLPPEAIRAVPPDLYTPSLTIEQAIGLSSVAEAAALAGAGEGARLLVPKLGRDGVTCAIAARSPGIQP